MLGNVADLVEESVTSDSLLNKSAEVRSSVTSYAIIVVEDAEAHEDTAETVAQPFRLVVLVRLNLAQNEGERVGGGEEESDSLGTAGNPGAQELEQAKSAGKGNIFRRNLVIMQFWQNVLMGMEVLQSKCQWCFKELPPAS